jgi:hypothetical protein
MCVYCTHDSLSLSVSLSVSPSTWLTGWTDCTYWLTNTEGQHALARGCEGGYGWRRTDTSGLWCRPWDRGQCKCCRMLLYVFMLFVSYDMIYAYDCMSVSTIYGIVFLVSFVLPFLVLCGTGGEEGSGRRLPPGDREISARSHRSKFFFLLFVCVRTFYRHQRCCTISLTSTTWH